MNKFILLLSIILLTKTTVSQNLYFPPLTGSAWETLSFSSLGWDSTKTDTLFNFLQAKNTKAFLVLKNGKIVIEKYFGTFTQDSIWYWASAGKTLTSFMIGLAQQEGYLSIQDSTSKYLGRWTSAPLNKEALITVRHQLTMTSGLKDNVPDPYCTLPSCLIYLADAGTRWAYHNGPYTLLDSVFQAATSQDLNQYFQLKLRNKTGMSGMFVKSGYNNVFYSIPRSMARFGLLVLNRGKWDTTTIMFDTNYFNQMVNTSQNLNKSYGYLWWLNGKESYMLPQSQTVFQGYLCPDAPADMIAALGKNGQLLNVVRSQNLIFVRMGTTTDTLFVSTVFNNDIWKLLNPVINPVNNIIKISNNIPDNYVLFDNYPNPFNPVTKIKFSLPVCHSCGGRNPGVMLKVFDILGKEIATLVSEQLQPGTYEVIFDGNNLSSGIYFYTLTLNDFIQTRKMLFLK